MKQNNSFIRDAATSINKNKNIFFLLKKFFTQKCYRISYGLQSCFTTVVSSLLAHLNEEKTIHYKPSRVNKKVSATEPILFTSSTLDDFKLPLKSQRTVQAMACITPSSTTTKY